MSILNWMKTSLSLATVAAVLSATASCSAATDGDLGAEALVLSRTEGSAPLEVSIQSPAALRDIWINWQKDKCVHSKWGDGFAIDWGDGTGDGDAGLGQSPTDATGGQPGKHIYRAAGKYVVSAHLYKFLPTDGHETYWRRKITVTVK